jgi:hypothetical protein
MRPLVIAGLMVLGLAACQRSIPASNVGVGFGDYAAYELERAQREAALTGTIPGAAPLPGTAPLAAPSGITTTDLAAAGIGGAAPVAGTAPNSDLFFGGSAPLDQTGLNADRREGLEASPGNAAPVLVGVNPGGISDEQDFGAVSERESIESDAARRAQQQAAYQVIAPEALPDAPQDTGPNIVDYALNAPNRLGQEYYSRFVLSGQRRFERNCSEYRSPDEAQRDFLARGGPERDPRGIDPDGDGFACGWDPTPFLAAAGRL